MIKNTLKNFKTKINGFRKKRVEALNAFKLSIKKSKANLPKSKFKKYMYGMGTSLAVFGIIIFSKPLMAFAKDVPPADAPKPGSTGVTPAPAPVPTTIQTLSGSASVLCALAAGSGSFVIGALCGAIVGVSILIVQGKIKVP